MSENTTETGPQEPKIEPTTHKPDSHDTAAATTADQLAGSKENPATTLQDLADGSEPTYDSTAKGMREKYDEMKKNFFHNPDDVNQLAKDGNIIAQRVVAADKASGLPPWTQERAETFKKMEPLDPSVVTGISPRPQDTTTFTLEEVTGNKAPAPTTNQDPMSLEEFGKPIPKKNELG